MALQVGYALSGIAQRLNAAVLTGDRVAGAKPLAGPAVLLAVDGKTATERIETGQPQTLIAHIEQIQNLRPERCLQASQTAPQVLRIAQAMHFTALVPRGE